MVLALGTLLAVSMLSCVEEKNAGGQQNETNDSTELVVDTAMQVTGVAIDGAMNSVYLLVGEDTVEFSYPDLDSQYRASWEIDDTLTVRYYVTENGDSVTQVINESDA